MKPARVHEYDRMTVEQQTRALALFEQLQELLEQYKLELLPRLIFEGNRITHEILLVIKK